MSLRYNADARTGVYASPRVGLLLYGSVVAAFVNMYLTQAILPVLARDFGVSPSTASLTVSVLILGIALSSLVIGPLSDRIGRKPLLAACALLLGLPSLLCALAPTLPLLLLGRALQGLLIPGLTAVSVAYIAEEFAPGRVGVWLGGYISANVLGGLLSRVTSGLIAESVGWRWAFVMGAGLTLGLGIALLRLRPSLRFTPSPGLSGAYAGMLRHLRTPRLLGGFSVGFALFFAFTAVFTYLPFHLEAPPFSFSQTAIGLVYLVYIAGIVSSPLSSLLAARLSQRSVMVLGLSVVLLGNFGTLLDRPLALIVALTVLCFGNFAAQGAATAFVATQAEHHRGGASSLYLFFYYVGGGLGAFVPGLLLSRFGWSGVLLCTTLALVLGIAAAYSLCKPEITANRLDSLR